MFSLKSKASPFDTSKPDNLGGRLLLAEQRFAHEQRLKKIHSAGSLGRPTTTETVSPRTFRNPEQHPLRHLKTYQEREHEKNLIRLAQALSRKKTIADRRKDPYDFYVYPVYFFRDTTKKTPSSSHFHPKYSSLYKSLGGTKSVKTLNRNERRPKMTGVEDEYGIMTKNHKVGKKRNVYTYKEPYHHDYELLEANADSLDTYSEQKGESGRVVNFLTSETIKNQLPYLRTFERSDIEEFADSLTRLVFNYKINSIEKLKHLETGVISVLPKSYPPKFIKVIKQIFNQMKESLGLPRK